MPLFRSVCFANGNDVHTVIVDGRIALEDRKAMFVDEEKILDAAQRECAADAQAGRGGRYDERAQERMGVTADR